jgi:uncharacterized protein (TIGR03067 family)
MTVNPVSGGLPMTRIRTLFAAALVLAAAPALADDAKDMVGAWAIEKATLGGKDFTGTLKDGKLTIAAGGKYESVVGGQTDTGTFTTDEKATPKAMDIKSETDGPLKGKTVPSIYELKGDSLTVCYDLDLKARPAKFESPDKSNVLLVVYKREKK